MNNCNPIRAKSLLVITNHLACTAPRYGATASHVEHGTALTGVCPLAPPPALQVEEAAARQRDLRSGRDRDTVVLELYEDVAFSWRSLQAVSDKNNRL